MLRRAPTTITLTTEDIAIYEDSRQAERDEQAEREVMAAAARHRKARQRQDFGAVKGDKYRESQAIAAQRRVDAARERAAGRAVDMEGDGNAENENEISEDEDRQILREREERAMRERLREREGQRPTRVLQRAREEREQRSREERLGLGGGNGSALGR
ncbi:hypothetical protein BCIN_05g00210 [Botrytis cinerea B05.10]|uniref:Anaphase-promoting complex, subunit CDC26 n=3 Tax=Botryotinia fuckeliana TaxID=40559 RepID=A0A384JGN0_BOTFB|nr:hypothetical protein BCIN_05g00210 [Botrytis cinerea B05.10]ATZ49592.1 hypothetical protein BCIN_05g00210 [Botrytis cinerea B05.10]EMR83822.1 hypothetical protein BcDW1_7563 [Botrytis cinerea BcDW1]CCD56140.1 hypothetical protein BofuT4_P147500.1 [Botrytis cinerea T4]